MNKRQGTAYDAHKCMVYFESLLYNGKGELSTKETIAAKQALDTAIKIYNRRKGVVER